MLVHLKNLLGIPTSDTSKDNLLMLILSQVEFETKAITHLSNVSALKLCMLDMAVYKYNMKDTYGVSSENYSGVSFNYSTDYPENIYKCLYAYRRIKVVE